MPTLKKKYNNKPPNHRKMQNLPGTGEAITVYRSSLTSD